MNPPLRPELSQSYNVANLSFYSTAFGWSAGYAGMTMVPLSSNTQEDAKTRYQVLPWPSKHGRGS